MLHFAIVIIGIKAKLRILFIRNAFHFAIA